MSWNIWHQPEDPDARSYRFREARNRRIEQARSEKVDPQVPDLTVPNEDLRDTLRAIGGFLKQFAAVVGLMVAGTLASFAGVLALLWAAGFLL